MLCTKGSAFLVVSPKNCTTILMLIFMAISSKFILKVAYLTTINLLFLTATLLLAAFPRDILQLQTLKALISSVCFALFNIHLLKHLLFIFHCMILPRSLAICWVCDSAVCFSTNMNCAVTVYTSDCLPPTFYHLRVNTITEVSSHVLCISYVLAILGILGCSSLFH